MKDKLKSHKEAVLIILFNLDNWGTDFKVECRPRARSARGLPLSCGIVTSQSRTEVLHLSAKIIDESACLCLDAVLICRKGRKKNQM